MSLADFAEPLGIGRSYLSKLESGDSKNPSQPLLDSICNTYAVRHEWLITAKEPVFVSAALNEQAAKGKLSPPEAGGFNRDEREQIEALTVARVVLGANPSPAQLASSLAEILHQPPGKLSLTVKIGAILAQELRHQLKQRG